MFPFGDELLISGEWQLIVILGETGLNQQIAHAL